MGMDEWGRRGTTGVNNGMNETTRTSAWDQLMLGHATMRRWPLGYIHTWLTPATYMAPAESSHATDLAGTPSTAPPRRELLRAFASFCVNGSFTCRLRLASVYKCTGM